VAPSKTTLSSALLLALFALLLATAGSALASAHPRAGRTAHPAVRVHRAHHWVIVRARCAAGHSRGPSARPACRGHALLTSWVAPSKAPAAVAPAATVAATCQNTDLTPEAGDLALVRGAVLCLINRERAAHGEAALADDPRLDGAAEQHSQELVADDYFAHISPGGETPADRIRATGYIPGPSVGYLIGENLAWGTFGLATPRAIVAAWVASPEHLANILELQYRDTGIGVTPAVPNSLGEGAPGATYAQEFGTIIN